MHVLSILLEQFSFLLLFLYFKESLSSWQKKQFKLQDREIVQKQEVKEKREIEDLKSNWTQFREKTDPKEN